MRTTWIAGSMLAGLVAAACGHDDARSSAAARADSARRALQRTALRKLADEGFPIWATRHPDQACPASLAVLAEVTDQRDTRDAWGHELIMKCGASAPAGARSGFGVVSVGPDGVEGTADDLTSW